MMKNIFIVVLIIAVGISGFFNITLSKKIKAENLVTKKLQSDKDALQNDLSNVTLSLNKTVQEKNILEEKIKNALLYSKAQNAFFCLGGIMVTECSTDNQSVLVTEFLNALDFLPNKDIAKQFRSYIEAKAAHKPVSTNFGEQVPSLLAQGIFNSLR